MLVVVNLGAASRSSSNSTVAAKPAKATVIASTQCRSARRALNYYRLRWASYREVRGLKTPVRLSQPHGCAHTRWAVEVWRDRARASREAHKQWLKARWLVKDAGDWERAVNQVQRFFPGTGSWLWSCSGAEGGHGRWVTYGGGSDFQWAAANYVVGGWMQFKWPTFKGMYREALDHIRSKGYRVEPAIADPGDINAWLSPTAQALAAGWARYMGEDDYHWSASFGNGC